VPIGKFLLVSEAIGRELSICQRSLVRRGAWLHTWRRSWKLPLALPQIDLLLHLLTNPPAAPCFVVLAILSLQHNHLDEQKASQDKIESPC
jgi:hypothetical protein